MSEGENVPTDFLDLVMWCTKRDELVAEYDRLSGSSLGDILKAGPLNRSIDDATGRTKEEMMKFAAFVFEVVWLRLPRECFANPQLEESKGK